MASPEDAIRSAVPGGIAKPLMLAVFRGPGEHRSAVEGDLCPSREILRTTNAGHVFRGDTVRLRVCPSRNGSFLLSD